MNSVSMFLPIIITNHLQTRPWFRVINALSRETYVRTRNSSLISGAHKHTVRWPSTARFFSGNPLRVRPVACLLPDPETTRPAAALGAQCNNNTGGSCSGGGGPAERAERLAVGPAPPPARPASTWGGRRARSRHVSADRGTVQTRSIFVQVVSS